ncbi:MAG: hypothetical protein WBA97_01125 [Actinophytocola sp.]|uniref:hypothetical protein n=1 Tax=Actinophytocola sp. TaxID=1872138 RepID=UPI003C75728B
MDLKISRDDATKRRKDVQMKPGDKERLETLRMLALDSAKNGDTKQAKNVMELGKAMEKQIKDEEQRGQ